MKLHKQFWFSTAAAPACLHLAWTRWQEGLLLGVLIWSTVGLTHICLAIHSRKPTQRPKASGAQSR